MTALHPCQPAAVHHLLQAGALALPKEDLCDALWRAGDSLQIAGKIMEQLHGLFAAIRKQSGAEATPLAQIGEGLTASWVDLLSDSAEGALALCKEHKTASPAVKPSSAPAPSPMAGATPHTVLSLDAYDAATLHLEKAETLTEMLDTLGHCGLQRLGPTHLASAISCLIDELTAVRKALEQGRQRGDA